MLYEDKEEYDISPIVEEPEPEEPEEKPSWWDNTWEWLTKKLPIVTNLRIYYDKDGNELHRESVDTLIENRYKGDYFRTKIEGIKTPTDMLIDLLPQPTSEFKEKYHWPTIMSIIEGKINKDEELSQEELDTVDTYMSGHMIRPPGYTTEQWSKVRPATQKAYNIAMMALIVAGVTSPVWSKIPLKGIIGKFGPTPKTLAQQVSKILEPHGIMPKWWRALSKGSPLSAETIHKIITPVSPKAAEQVAKLYNITLPVYTAPLPTISGALPTPFYSGLPIEFKMVAETVNALPKFTPLANLARQMGLTVIPDIGTSQYIKFYDGLDDKQQELLLEREELLEDTMKAFKGGPKEEVEIAQIKSEQEKLLTTTKELPDIVPYTSLTKPEIAPKAGLFAPEEVETTRQMDMYKQELAILEKAGVTGREAEKIAMKIAGDKYMKKTGKPATQLKWEFGKPTLPGQKELGLEETVSRAGIEKVVPKVGEIVAKPEIAPKTTLTPEITASHEKFTTFMASYEKETDPVKKLEFAEKAHLARNKAIAEAGVDVLGKKELLPDLETIEYEDYPPAELVVREMKDGLKAKQNTGIIKQITETNTLPSSTQQQVYIYNLTGETIAGTDEIQEQFLRLLKATDNRAYNHLFRAALTDEEVATRLTQTTKEMETLRPDVDIEMEGLRDYVSPKGETEIEEYRTFLGTIRENGGIKYGSGTRDYKDQYKNWPLSVKRKTGIDLDELADLMKMDIEVLADKLSYPPAPAEAFEAEAVETMENNINDFPAYKKMKEIEEKIETLRIEALDRNVKLPEPAPTEKVVENIPVKPPITTDKIKPSPEFEANMEEALAGWKQLKSWDQLEFSHKDLLRAPTTQYDLAPAEPPSKIPPEQMFFSDIVPPEDLPVDIKPWPVAKKDIRFLMKLRRVGDAMSDFERATGVPVYSQGFRGIYDAARLKDDESLILNATVKNIFKGIKKERRVEIGKAMEKKKTTLSPEEKTTLEAIQNFSIFLGGKFNVPKERMIKWYLPHLMQAFRTSDPTKISKEFEPFFKKIRQYEDVKSRIEDPSKIFSIYIGQGLKSKYFYDNKLIPNFIKHIQNQPIGFKDWAKDWLANDILKRPTKLDRAAGGLMEDVMGKTLEKWDTTGVVALGHITKAVGSLMYSSALGFRLASVAKQASQYGHWIPIYGPVYFMRGITRAFNPEEKKLVESLNILRQYGVMLERHGIDAPINVPQKIVNAALYLFMKGDAGDRRLGHGAQTVLTEDAYALLKSEAINEEEFFKMTKLNLTLWSDQPRIKEIFRTRGPQAYADEVAKDLVHLTQYDYSSANMPTLFAGKMGRLFGMFTSWPIQFAEMQARYFKQGEKIRFLYYILTSLAIINAARLAGIETGEPGYPEVKVGNTRIALIPGGWFLTGSMPTDVAPSAQIMYQGGKLVMAVMGGGWDYWAKSAFSDFKRASKLLVPLGISSSDLHQMFKELKDGKYGKRDKNGRLIYISDEAEVIMRGLGLTTTKEIEETGRDTGPKLELKGYKLPWQTDGGNSKEKAPSCLYHLP